MARFIVLFALIALTSVAVANVVNRPFKQSENEIENPIDEILHDTQFQKHEENFDESDEESQVMKITLRSITVHRQEDGEIADESDESKMLKYRQNDEEDEVKEEEELIKKQNDEKKDVDDVEEVRKRQNGEEETTDEEEELKKNQSDDEKEADDEEEIRNKQNDDEGSESNNEENEEELKKRHNNVEDETESEEELKNKQNDEEDDSDKNEEEITKRQNDEEEEADDVEELKIKQSEDEAEEEIEESEDENLKAKQGISWTTCDFAIDPRISCADCSTRLVCEPVGAKLIACSNPLRPYCNNGACSGTPSDACSQK